MYIYIDISFELVYILKANRRNERKEDEELSAVVGLQPEGLEDPLYMQPI